MLIFWADLLTFLNILRQQPRLVWLPIIVHIAGELGPGPEMQKLLIKEFIMLK